MRVSTPLIYARGVAAIQEQQSELLATQQRLATGRRVLTPADDPIASAQALQVTQAISVNDQLRVNRDYATGQLTNVESTLGHAVEIVQRVRELAVAAGDAAYSASERASMADELDGLFQQLVATANATDAQGHYLFSGYQGGTQPFVLAPGGVQFTGDDGERLVQVSPTRRIAENVSGADAFQRARTGNGSFAWAANAANTGGGVIGPGSVLVPAATTAANYEITFSVGAGGTTYDVVNTTTATSVLSGQAYTGSAASIAFDGIVVELQGEPANGDRFTVAPSTAQSVFSTVGNLIAGLRAHTAGGAPLSNDLNIALTNLDQAIDGMLTQRVAVGTRLREIDALQASGEALGVQYEDTRSRLIDVDYAKAISDLALQQANLEAAQRSFATTAQLSLFDYL